MKKDKLFVFLIICSVIIFAMHFVGTESDRISEPKRIDELQERMHYVELIVINHNKYIGEHKTVMHYGKDHNERKKTPYRWRLLKP